MWILVLNGLKFGAGYHIFSRMVTNKLIDTCKILIRTTAQILIKPANLGF